MVKKVRRLQVYSGWRFWQGEGRSGLTRNRNHMSLVWGAYLVSPELEAGEKIGKLAVTDHVLTALGRLLQGMWVGFVSYLLQRL